MRRGDWMQTFTGRKFWPIDPRADEVNIHDIAHALSFMCRFGGHCREFYSVAEHSVRVSRLANTPEPIGLAALLHDAAEAYVVDVPRPLKRSIVGYREIESRVARVIEQRFGLETGILDHPAIKQWDEILLATEARDLMGGESAGKWNLQASPLPERIMPESADEAEWSFLARFTALGGKS